MNFPVRTPELSILEAQKEVAKYGEITSRMSEFTRQMLFSVERKEQRKIQERIAKYDKITDRVEVEVTEYLTKIARDELSSKLAIRVRSIMSICSELERIGDSFYKMSNIIAQKKEDRVWFTQHQRNRLTQLFNQIDNAFTVMVENLSNPHYGDVRKEAAVLIMQKIHDLVTLLDQENREDIKTQEYPISSALAYNKLLTSLEKIGDHITNISESLTGEI